MDGERDLRTWLEMICGSMGVNIPEIGLSDCDLAARIYAQSVAKNFAAKEVQKTIAEYLRVQA